MQRAAGIRHNRVLVLLLIEQDGLGGLRKQVDDRTAAEAESLDAETLVSRRWRRSSPSKRENKNTSSILRLNPAAQACRRPVTSTKKNFSGNVKYSCSNR